MLSPFHLIEEAWPLPRNARFLAKWSALANDAIQSEPRPGVPKHSGVLEIGGKRSVASAVAGFPVSEPAIFRSPNTNETMKDGALRITDGKGVDVVVDGVSGNLTGQALASLAFGGTVVVVGYAGGRQADVSITDIIWKGATIRGFTFRLFKPETVAAAREVLLGYLKAGDLQPTIAKVFPLSDAPEAVRYLIEDRPFGRVLMRV